jgi:hypothetical protein
MVTGTLPNKPINPPEAAKDLKGTTHIIPTTAVTAVPTPEDATQSPTRLPVVDSTNPRPQRRELESPSPTQMEQPGISTPMLRPQPPFPRRSPIVPPIAAVLLIPVVLMVLVKILGGRSSSGGKRAVDEVLIRHMLAMAQKGTQEGDTGRVEALMRMAQLTDPNAALATRRAVVEVGTVAEEGGSEEARPGVVWKDAAL